MHKNMWCKKVKYVSGLRVRGTSGGGDDAEWWWFCMNIQRFLWIDYFMCSLHSECLNHRNWLWKGSGSTRSSQAPHPVSEGVTSPATIMEDAHVVFSISFFWSLPAACGGGNADQSVNREPWLPASLPQETKTESLLISASWSRPWGTWTLPLNPNPLTPFSSFRPRP